jgi:hypothetical protein
MACLPFTELNKKEDYQQNIFHGMLLAPARIMPVDTHTCSNGYPVGLAQETPRGE